MIKPLSKALREALARAYPDATRNDPEPGCMRVVAAADDIVQRRKKVFSFGPK